MESASITAAYMWAFVTLAVMFLIAVLVANGTPFKPNNPGTTKRRIWFWVLCVLTGVVSFLINFIIATGIKVPSQHGDYMMHAAIASGAALVLFIVIGFLVSKIFSSKKVGTWF